MHAGHICAAGMLFAALFAGSPVDALPAAGHYDMADFERVDKIDTHVHLNGPADAFLAEARASGFRILMIDVDSPDFPPVGAQQAYSRTLRSTYPGRLAYATTFSAEGFNDPAWLARTEQELDAELAGGAVAVKVWKNFGMSVRDSNHHLVMVDDARLAPLFDHLEQAGVVVLGHQGEPRNCWLPLDQMTIKGDAEYYRDHPQYHMALHPDMPSYEAQLAARDHLLAMHPHLKFVALHLASLEWSVAALERFLDRFPNASVDLAARLTHLERAARTHPREVREFFLRYQDRILYGTDLTLEINEAPTDLVAEARTSWRADWRFLNTGDVMHASEFEGSFRGLALPKPVIDKIYHGNARRLFPGAFDTD